MTKKKQNNKTESQPEPTEVKPLVTPGKTPAFKLNLMDRFYLAVTKKSVGNLVFVYTLGCAGQNFRYDATATVDIATFDSESIADIYYQTILEVIDYEKRSKLSKTYDLMLAFNAGLLETFNTK